MVGAARLAARGPLHEKRHGRTRLFADRSLRCLWRLLRPHYRHSEAVQIAPNRTSAGAGENPASGRQGEGWVVPILGVLDTSRVPLTGNLARFTMPSSSRSKAPATASDSMPTSCRSTSAPRPSSLRRRRLGVAAARQERPAPITTTADHRSHLVRQVGKIQCPLPRILHRPLTAGADSDEAEHRAQGWITVERSRAGQRRDAKTGCGPQTTAGAPTSLPAAIRQLVDVDNPGVAEHGIASLASARFDANLNPIFEVCDILERFSDMRRVPVTPHDPNRKTPAWLRDMHRRVKSAAANRPKPKPYTVTIEQLT